MLFDAVGTVIRPEPDVVSVYENFGNSYGCQLTRQELKHRIGQARQKYFSVCPSSKVAEQIGQSCFLESADDNFVSSDEIELRLWRQLVVEVFNELPNSNQLFEELWEHFRLPQHWRLYDDAAQCWDRLRKQGCLIGLASNFDSRLIQLCDSIPLLKTADFVFQSAGVGYRKPSLDFYRTVERELQNLAACPDAGARKIYMVGDDLVNDCIGPNRAGWSGFWLNRSRKPIEAVEVQQVATLGEFAGQVGT